MFEIQQYGSCHYLVRWENRLEFDRCASTLFHLLTTAPPDDLIEYTPGYQTLLLQFHRPHQEESVQEYITAASQTAVEHHNATASLINIPVRYDGPDLVDLAQARGISTSEVIRRHTAPTYTVYFMGFSPGFPYLGPLDITLHTPRMASPRPRIPAGSVAIGGSHTGIYSVESAGGWHIIGHTDFPLFTRAAAKTTRPATRDVFTLHPGDQIKLIPQRL